jgi:hypothetical protein
MQTTLTHRDGSEVHTAGQHAERAWHPAAESLRSLRPLAIDVGIPLGSYFFLRDGLGTSLWLALALSSAGPMIREAYGILVRREINLLAALMLAANTAGIAVAFITGDPRAMIAKDSLVSSVIAIAILGSVAARRPLMTAGLKPYLTKGTPERLAAWDRLSARSASFRRLELLFSGIWGTALLAECVARLLGAYTLPVTTMAWLGTVFTLCAIGLAVVVGGVAAGPMARLIERQAIATGCESDDYEEAR